jgi:hypothetical protein
MLIVMKDQEQKLYVHLDLLRGTRKFWRLLHLRGTNPKRLLVIIVDGVISLLFTLREGEHVEVEASPVNDDS